MKSILHLVAFATIFAVAACSAEAPAEIQTSKDGTSSPSAATDDASLGDKPTSKSSDASGSDGASPTKSETSAGAACDEAPPASLPQVTSEFLTSTPPAMKGGDEKGTWVFTKVTAYLSKSSGALVDLEASTVEGTGFTKLDGSHFVTSSNLTQTIKLKLLGSQEAAMVLKVGGTYAYDHGRLTFTTQCSEGTQEGGKEPTDTGFSRLSETEALFHQTIETPMGKVVVVTTMKKAS